MIATPSLRDQLADKPADLPYLIDSIVRRVVGRPNEKLCGEIADWIGEHIGPEYDWPGNFRELEQCVRNLIVRGSYVPARQQAVTASDRFTAEIKAGQLTADELVSRYCTLIYSETNNYEETARRVKLDRRTVKAKIDPRFLDELRGKGN